MELSLDSTSKARTFKPSQFLAAFNFCITGTVHPEFNLLFILSNTHPKPTLQKYLQWIWTLLELCWISSLSISFLFLVISLVWFGFAHDLGQKPLTEWWFHLLNFSLEELWPWLKMLRYSTVVQNVLLHFHSLIFAFLRADNCLIFREKFSQCFPELHQWLFQIISINWK